MIINEDRLAEIRTQKCSTGNCPCHEQWETLCHSLERLWRVVRAAKRWTVARPGRESVMKEAEMQVELDELYAEMRQQSLPRPPPEPTEDNEASA